MKWVIALEILVGFPKSGCNVRWEPFFVLPFQVVNLEERFCQGSLVCSKFVSYSLEHSSLLTANFTHSNLTLSC